MHPGLHAAASYEPGEMLGRTSIGAINPKPLFAASVMAGATTREAGDLNQTCRGIPHCLAAQKHTPLNGQSAIQFGGV